MWAWLCIAKKTRHTAIIRGIVAVAAGAIGIGAIWCQLTVHPYPGNPHCGKGTQPLCDVVMGVGEGLFYAIWALSGFLWLQTLVALPWGLGENCELACPMHLGSWALASLVRQWPPDAFKWWFEAGYSSLL